MRTSFSANNPKALPVHNGSLFLSQIHSPYWLFFTAFVGVNLFQSSFTGFCPLAKFLKAMGVKAGAVFNV